MQDFFRLFSDLFPSGGAHARAFAFVGKKTVWGHVFLRKGGLCLSCKKKCFDEKKFKKNTHILKSL